MPSLSSFVPNDRPLKPFSTMKAVMPRGPASGVGLGVDDHRVGVAAVGDPHLRAVEHVAVALRLGAQLHADDVGAGVRLAHRERADVLAATRASAGTSPSARRCRCGAAGSRTRFECAPYERPDRRRGARHLFHRDDVREVAEVGAAVLLLHRHAVQAERAELLPEVGAGTGCRGRCGGARRDLVGGEVLRSRRAAARWCRRGRRRVLVRWDIESPSVRRLGCADRSARGGLRRRPRILPRASIDRRSGSTLRVMSRQHVAHAEQLAHADRERRLHPVLRAGDRDAEVLAAHRHRRRHRPHVADVLALRLVPAALLANGGCRRTVARGPSSSRR